MVGIAIFRQYKSTQEDSQVCGMWNVGTSATFKPTLSAKPIIRYSIPLNLIPQNLNSNCFYPPLYYILQQQQFNRKQKMLSPQEGLDKNFLSMLLCLLNS